MPRWFGRVPGTYGVKFPHRSMGHGRQSDWQAPFLTFLITLNLTLPLLAEKYGLVPKSVYPETYHSSNTSRLDGFLTSKLRDFALELRSLYQKGKKEYLATCKEGEEGRAKEVGIERARSAKGEMVRLPLFSFLLPLTLTGWMRCRWRRSTES